MPNPFQLNLQLVPPNPFGEEYFVSHSGVEDALRKLEQLIRFSLNGGRFCSIVVSGPDGSGKRHFLELGAARALAAGFPASQVILWRDERSRQLSREPDGAEPLPARPGEEILGSFVASFEDAKRRNGLLLVRRGPELQRVEENPHASSRLNASEHLLLQRPTEAEFTRVISSVLQRRNLSLSAASIHYMVSRLPANVSSFDEVFYRLNEMSQPYKKAGSIHSIRQVVNSDGD